VAARSASLRSHARGRPRIIERLASTSAAEREPPRLDGGYPSIEEGIETGVIERRDKFGAYEEAEFDELAQPAFLAKPSPHPSRLARHWAYARIALATLQPPSTAATCFQA
jgi:hypothetical protein